METPWDRTVLGVDQSLSSTGMVVGGQGNIDFVDVFTTKPDKTDDLSNYKRCIDITTAIVTVAEQHMVDKIYIEDLSFNAPGSSNRQLAGLLYTIVTSLISRGFDVQVIPPKSLKKFASGNGNAKKSDMFDCLPEEFKSTVKKFPKSSQDDVTDAYWLCRYDEYLDLK